MRLISPADFRTQPWKNGGGVTHEIAREDDGNRLLWRLSIAEVASDGPFSSFPGLARILTVIEGAGIVLETAGGPIAAHPLDPVAFPGDLPVIGRLLAGPIRDLNVIYDPGRIDASVTLVSTVTRPAGRAALLCVSGRFRIGDEDLTPGSVAFLDDEAAIGTRATGLLVTLAPRPA